jgi:hypothetical protein
MYKLAINGLISIFTLSLLFHIMVIMGVVPPNIVWGGRAQDSSALMRLEIVSIAINSMFLAFMLIINQTIKLSIKSSIVKIILWIMSIVFLLNSIGNLLAKSSVETIIFTPITIILCVFSLYLAVNYKKS